MKYYLTATYHDRCQDYMDLNEEYASIEAAVERINACGPLYTFRLIEGKELKVVPVQSVTKYEVKRA